MPFPIWPGSQNSLGGKGPPEIIQPDALLSGRVSWSRLSWVTATWVCSISTDGDFNASLANLCQRLSTLAVKCVFLCWDGLSCVLVCVCCLLSSHCPQPLAGHGTVTFQTTDGSKKPTVVFSSSKLILSSPFSVTQTCALPTATVHSRHHLDFF